MIDSSETVCITCGLPSGDPPRLNHLPGGQVCPACRDRLLATLPPLLPSDSGEQLRDEEREPSMPESTTWGPHIPDSPA
jgi:hypothetical protein